MYKIYTQILVEKYKQHLLSSVLIKFHQTSKH